MDDDGDGVTDSMLDYNEIGFAGSDDVDLDLDDNDVPNDWEPDTIEGQAEDQETVTEHTNEMSDWGNVGKQHFTNQNYAD